MRFQVKLVFFLALITSSTAAYAKIHCDKAAPQTPRDISNAVGENSVKFPYAPSYTEVNLCNIHLHKNAEHKGPGFSVYLGKGEFDGYACNNVDSLSKEELKMPNNKHYYDGVKPGDTLEVHWVYSSCDIEPGKGLESCVTNECENPQLRVEAQVFLLVNDKNAANFLDYIYDNTVRDGRYQAKSLPQSKKDPIVFRGSTTGSKYSDYICSDVHVTWSVRPKCMKLNISSLDDWAQKGNVFEEYSPHGVRALVIDPKLLSEIH